MLRNFGLEKFDIIIQAGQSNSEGCGIGDTTIPFAQGPDIFYMENDYSICTAHEYVSGNFIVGNFSLSFSSSYSADGWLESGRKILILRAAEGGTGFRDNRWGICDDLYLRMMEMTKTALSLNTENRLAAFLWHQGETDAILNAGRQEHYNNLIRLVSSVRETFRCPDLPFIAGDFVSHWKNDNLEICMPVVEAIRDVCTDIGYAAFVETDGLTSNAQVINNEDTIHFSREAQNQLGLRYFEAFKNIKKEKSENSK
jgi:hypothetical protein